MIDSTGYWFEVDTNNWKPFVTLLADCMENAVFDEQCFAAEVKTILQELREDDENVENRLSAAFIRSLLPVEHPYHGLSSGNMRDFAAVTTQKMSEFYKKYYRSEFATVVIFGDIDPQEALEYAENQLSQLPSEHTKLPDVFSGQQVSEFGIHNVMYDRYKTPSVFLGWPIPKGGGKDYACASLVCDLLDSGVSGVLQKRLLDHDRCAEKLDAEMMVGRGASFLYITCHPLKNKIDQCVHAILEELHTIATKGIKEGALANILRKKKLDAALRYESITSSCAGIPTEWVERYAASEDMQDFLNPLRLFESITPQDVQDFVAKFLTVESMSRIDMLPLSDEVRPAWLAQKAADRELEKKILQAHVRTRPIVPPLIPEKYPQAQAPIVAVPTISLQKTLANGMHVIVVNKPEAPVCAIHIGHRDAQYYDQALDGKPISVVSQMLLEGTETMPKHQALDWFDERGVSYDFSRCDWTATSLPQDVHDVLAHICTLMHQPAFDAAALKKVKKRLAHQILRMKDRSSDMQDRAIAHALWPNTVYDWSFDDARAAIMNVTPESLRSLHAKLVNPAALICVVVGNVNPEDVIKNIERYTAEWKSEPYISAPAVEWAKPVVGCDVHTEYGQTQLVYIRPSQITFDHQYVPSLKVLSQELFKSFGSRLFNIREATGLFYAARGEFAEGLSKKPGYDIVSAQVGIGKLSDAERRFKQFITVDIAKPINQHDFDGARAGYYSELVSLLSGVDGCAEYFLDLERKGWGQDYYKILLQHIDRLDVATVSSVAREYALSGQFARVRVGSL